MDTLPGAAGSLPPTWGSVNAFPALTYLALNTNFLSGTLPPAWATPSAFPKVGWRKRQCRREMSVRGIDGYSDGMLRGAVPKLPAFSSRP